MILAGDVGGSKTLLGLFRQAGGKLRVEREASFPSREFRSFGSLVDEFLSQAPAKVRDCAIGVAGPVVGGRSQVVNLPWTVDRSRLARRLATPAVRVINDLEATAWGVPDLPPRKFHDLTPGLRPRAGTAALIAAGTGLGMALIFRDGDRWLPCPSEGGHQAFGPRDELECELWKFLRRRYGRVSVERGASGPAVSTIYEFLVTSGRGKRTRKMDRRFAETDDPNAAVAGAALAGADATARRALDRFLSIYGAAAGDLALVAKATGGVWVGGGIAPKVLPRLTNGGFLQAFRDKGRMAPLLAEIPVRVILEPRTAMLGAARCAATFATRRPQPRKKDKR